MSRAKPKSHILRTPFLDRSMFSGLKSLWMMLCEWMNWQAFKIYHIIFLA